MEKRIPRNIDTIIHLPKSEDKRKVVVNEAEEWVRKGKEKMENELEKTPDDVKLIEDIASSVDALFLEQFKIKAKEIPLENIHIIKGEDVGFEGKGEMRTRYHPVTDEVRIVYRDKILGLPENKIDRALTMFHELVHAKSFSSLQYTKVEGEEDNKEGIWPYRSGLSIFSPKRGRTEFLDGLNEAVVQTLTLSFYKSISKDERFKDEAARVDDESLELMHNKAYLEERRVMEALINELYEKNKNVFSGRGEVKKLVIEASLTGNILKLGKLVDRTFGKGSFRLLDKLSIMEAIGQQQGRSLTEWFEEQRKKDRKKTEK